MIALLQRVASASVDVGGVTLGAIGQGLLVFVGVEKEDCEAQADRLLERILGYRVFEDDEGKMNNSLQDVKGGLLLVPQFTLAANTHKGMRPSFSSAASPEMGRVMFEYLLSRAMHSYDPVMAGRFGADMQVSLINDGPVTFWLRA